MNIKNNQQRFKFYNIFIFSNQLLLPLTTIMTVNKFHLRHSIFIVLINNNNNKNNNTTHKTDHCYPNTHLCQLQKVPRPQNRQSANFMNYIHAIVRGRTTKVWHLPLTRCGKCWRHCKRQQASHLPGTKYNLQQTTFNLLERSKYG